MGEILSKIPPIPDGAKRLGEDKRPLLRAVCIPHILSRAIPPNWISNRQGGEHMLLLPTHRLFALWPFLYVCCLGKFFCPTYFIPRLARPKSISFDPCELGESRKKGHCKGLLFQRERLFFISRFGMIRWILRVFHKQMQKILFLVVFHRSECLFCTEIEVNVIIGQRSFVYTSVNTMVSK